MHFEQLKRRECITLLGGVAAWPASGRSQSLPLPIIGHLDTGYNLHPHIWPASAWD